MKKYFRIFIKSERSARQNRFSIILIFASLARCYQDDFVKSRRIKFLRASHAIRVYNEMLIIVKKKYDNDILLNALIKSARCVVRMRKNIE